MANKVAFLALTYSNFTHPRVMEEFFDPDKQDLYNLYIHNKEPIEDNYFRNYSIDDRVRTRWGHHSLVIATIKLLKTALADDADNSHFILMSDSHCPLYNITKTCEIIQERYNKLSFTVFPADSGATIHARFKYALLFNKGKFRLSHACKVHQWFVCTRSDAEFFVNAFVSNERFFVKCRNTYTDEFYFHLMANTYGIPFQFVNNCDVDWFKPTEPSVISELGCRENPYTYTNITIPKIDQMRLDNNIFCRKIYEKTKLPLKHIFA